MSEPMQIPEQVPVYTRGLEVVDFSGGKTDNHIACEMNQFQDADNFYLNTYGNRAKLKTRPGSVIYDEDYPRIPNNSRLATLVESESTLFQVSARKLYTINAGWTTVTGPTGNDALSAGSSTSYHAWALWNKHLVLTTDALSRPMKVFNDGSWRVRNLGLPTVTTSGISAALTAGATPLSYIYAFILSDSYTIGTVTYREVSAPTLKTVAGNGTAIAGGAACSITSIPVLSNGSTANYNTSAIKVEIYRTVNNGTTFYKVGEVTNGTTSYSDTTTDATLVTNAALYTEGGIVDFDEPPLCKYVVVANDIAWYLHVQEGSSVYPSRVRQSIQGALYAAPDEFSDDLEDEIIGGSSIGIYPIIFCKNKVYRLEGYYDDFGGGGFVKRELPNSVGCVSHRSIVTTRDGIFWASQSGFMWTDGFSIKKVSDEFNTSYAEIVASTTLQGRIYGTYDAIENRVFWAAQRDSLGDDNDIVFVADLNYRQVTDTGFKVPFTTMSGGEGNETNFSPTSLIVFNGHLLRGDVRGYLFKHDDIYNTDPKIDTGSAVDTWEEVVIKYDYRGPAFDFGTTEVRKWVPRICVNADNVSNLSLGISVMDDNAGVYNDLAEVKVTSNYLWGDNTATWGDDTLRWNYVPTVAHWRRVPSGTLRCMLKQVRLSNSYTLIDSSAILGTATVENTTNTVTLDDNTMDWLDDVVDYYISFESENYAYEYLITARTSDTVLTIDDSLTTLQNSTATGWKIYGYKKGNIFSLISYVIEWSPLTMSQTPYRA